MLEAAGRIQPDQIDIQIDMPGDWFLCQIKDVPHPSDVTAAIGPPVFRAQPALSAPVESQQPVPVKMGEKALLVALTEDAFLFHVKDCRAARITHLSAQISSLDPQKFDLVLLQISLHPHHEIRYQSLRHRLLIWRSAAPAASALREVFQHADSPHGPAHFVKEHPV